MEKKLLAGFGQKEITPEVPVPLSGFAGTRTATGVHDALYAHSMVIQKNGELFAIVSVDLLSVSDELVSQVAAKLLPLGFVREHIIISATHTHSGPVGINDSDTGLTKGMDYFLGHKDAAYISFVTEDIVASVKQAVSSLQEQHLKIGKTKVADIFGNRSRPDAAYDNTLLILAFESSTGEKNILLRFSCHPTVLNASNTLISADFPSYLYAELQNRYQHVMFMNGACGDISTRYKRHSADFKEIERMGKIILQAALHSLESPCYDGDFNWFSSASTSFPIATKQPGDLPKLQAKHDKMEEGLEKISLQADIQYACFQKQRVVDFKVCMINMQQLKFIFMPVEIYSSLAMQFVDKAHYYNGFSNDYFTYLPDTLAYESGEYEAHMTPFARGEGERIIAETEKWLEDI